MNSCGLLISLLLCTAPLPDNAITISARIDAESLDVGKSYNIVLDLKLLDGISTSDAGIPAPIVQIDVPKSVTLEGKVLHEIRELAKNEYLQAPCERLVEEWPATIKFELKRKPSQNEQFHLNILAYVHTDDNDYFVRRRIALPVVAGASSVSAAPTISDWGDGKTLQLGDKAIPFTLPRADGTKLRLAQYLGKQNIILTTYRAHW